MSGMIQYLRELHFASVVVRLALAMLLGGCIGLERGRKRRPAGFRTYMLVCLGAALTVLLSLYEFTMVTGPWSDICAEIGIKTDCTPGISSCSSRVQGRSVCRQDGVIYRCQRHRMRRCRQKRQQQRGTQHTADDFFDTHSLLSAIRTNILYQSTAGLSPFLPKNTLRCENRVL